MTMRLLRVYHGGGEFRGQERERALSAAGVDVTLVVPSNWRSTALAKPSAAEPFRVVEMEVRRPGDVNRHSYVDARAVRKVIHEVRPDVLDIHEEPVSLSGSQWLREAPTGVPVIMYTAQNVDKRVPPPFYWYEQAAHRRVAAFYPCSRQAAAVLRGKGFSGVIEVLPLGYDDDVFVAGAQSVGEDELVLMFVGRVAREKGADDAVRVLARVHSVRPTRLVVSGEGRDLARIRALAAVLGVADRIEFWPWQEERELAALYRSAHFVLVPSRPTSRWVEQFGRVIVEAQASGAVVAGYASGAIAEVGGTAAVLVAPGDIERLVANVLNVTGDSELFAQMRDAGLRQVAAKTWREVAASHAQVCVDAHSCELFASKLPSSPRLRRAAARREFGPTALTPSGARPFALPVLRRGGVIARALAAFIDATAELAAQTSFARALKQRH